MANPYGLKVGSSVCVIRAERNRKRYTEEELEVCMVATVGRKYFTIKNLAYGARFNLDDLSEESQNVEYLVFTDVQHFRDTQELDKIKDALFDYTSHMRWNNHPIRNVPMEDLRTVMRLLKIDLEAVK